MLRYCGSGSGLSQVVRAWPNLSRVKRVLVLLAALILVVNPVVNGAWAVASLGLRGVALALILGPLCAVSSWWIIAGIVHAGSHDRQ